MAETRQSGKSQPQMMLDDIDRKPISDEEYSRILNGGLMTSDWEKVLASYGTPEVGKASEKL